MHNPRVRPLSSLLYTCIAFPPSISSFSETPASHEEQKPLQGAAAHLQRDWRSCSIRTYVKHFWKADWFVPFLYWYAASWVCLMWIPSLVLSVCVGCCRRSASKRNLLFPPSMQDILFWTPHMCHLTINIGKSEHDTVFQIHWSRLLKDISCSLLVKQKPWANK